LSIFSTSDVASTACTSVEEMQDDAPVPPGSDIHSFGTMQDDAPVPPGSDIHSFGTPQGLMVTNIPTPLVLSMASGISSCLRPRQESPQTGSTVSNVLTDLSS
jgi:hypothetical protein